MRQTRIVHIIESLGRGGAARTVLAHARESQRSGEFAHSIISLSKAEDSVLEHSRLNGITILDQPERHVILDYIEDADLVQIQFYNSPLLYNFFTDQLPPARMLLWSHIGGDAPPQVLPAAVSSKMDYIALTAQSSLDYLNARRSTNLMQKATVVIGGADFQRIDHLQQKAHGSFNVGYIGTIDPVKMHPRFVEMSSAIDVPHIRFIVCGGGTGQLKSRISALKATDRFKLYGYVENIRPVLEALDVFGYPLCEGNYSTTDQSLQEAMFAGIPPVIFAHGATQHAVQNNKTGIVVNSETDYKNAIRHLAENKATRERLGRNARAYAEKNFGVARTAPMLDEIYRQVICMPKRAWLPLSISATADSSRKMSGAELFILSLGEFGRDFDASLHGGSAGRDADRRIANASPLLASRQSGGILHYRAHFPNDPFLHMWSGLVLGKMNHHARALIEFRSAIQLGCDIRRLSDYIHETAQAMGASKAAILAATSVGQDAPPRP